MSYLSTLPSPVTHLRHIHKVSVFLFAIMCSLTLIPLFQNLNNTNSQSRNILPAVTALPQPFNLSAPTFSCNQGTPQVVLNWSASVNAVSYTVSRNSPGGTGWPQIAIGITPTTLTTTSFPVGNGVYQYQVRAVSAKGGEKYSNIQAVTITDCTSPAPAPIAPTPAPAPTPTPAVAPVVSPIATPVPAPVTGVIGNLIQNAGLETDANQDGIPDQWIKGAWGTSNRVFSYPVGSKDGTRAASISMSGYVSGDAKWTFTNIGVTPNTMYRFQDQYLSTALTQVVLEYTSTSGANSYILLGSLPSSANTWTSFSRSFTTPSDVASVRVFHLIAGNGILTIDNVSLVNTTTTATPPPAPTPTPAVAPAPVVSPAPSVAPSPAPLPISTAPATKPLWGAYVGWQELNMDDFESRVGKITDLRAVFVHWGNESQFPMYIAPYVRDRNKTLVIFWEATDYNVATTEQPRFNYDAILRGDWDAYFRSFAASAKTYNAPVILIPFSEMNGDWFTVSGTKNGNTPAKHIAAYRYIREFFRTTPNVQFGWAPNNGSVPDVAGNQIADYYPGDAYVDIVGVDGFNFGGTQWETFSQVFDKSLLQLNTYKKPVYLFSFSSQSDTRKAAWIKDALQVQLPKHPEIKGWVWFNELKSHNWLVWSDQTALDAFRASI